MNTQQLIFVGGLALSAASVAICVYALVVLQKLKKLRDNLGSEHQAENLEEILNAMISKIKTLERVEAETNQNLDETTLQTSMAVKKVGLIKFNSLADEGGNLSFSLALLDSKNSGIVLTSMNGRQQNRLYAKAVIESVGEIPLNEEEQQAVMLAVHTHKDKAQK